MFNAQIFFVHFNLASMCFCVLFWNKLCYFLTFNKVYYFTINHVNTYCILTQLYLLHSLSYFILGQINMTILRFSLTLKNFNTILFSVKVGFKVFNPKYELTRHEYNPMIRIIRPISMHVSIYKIYLNKHFYLTPKPMNQSTRVKCKGK